jgi:Transposase IS4
LTPNQRQPPNSQNSSQQASSQAANRERKEEWQIQLESTRNKPQKLQILREVIGPHRSYPEKLNIPQPAASGRPLLKAHQYKPLDLFHRLIPKELFQETADHTNEYALEETTRDFAQHQEWIPVTAADIGGYIGAVLLIGVQPGGRDLAYY